MTFLLAISERSLGDRKLTEDSLIKESSRYRMYYKASFSLCLSLSFIASFDQCPFEREEKDL